MSLRSGMIAVFLAATLLVVVACNGEDGIDASLPTTTAGEDGETADTTQAPETTAPATTEAPPSDAATATTVTDGEDTGSNAAVWAIVVAVLVILGIILWVIGRGGGKAGGQQVAVAPTTTEDWKSFARTGHAESLWLYDNMTDGLAVWRGNATYDGTETEGATAATGQAHTWSQLDGRMKSATDALYAVEAAPPDRATADVARRVVAGLTAVRSALDSRADARYEYRTAEAASERPEDPSVVAARDREQRSSQSLESARGQLLSSLTSLSAVT